MKKLKVLGLLLVMVIGFVNGWVAFNYAAKHAEAKIRDLKEKNAPIETITREELEKEECEQYMTGTMRSVGEWAYDALNRSYEKHKAEFPEYHGSGEYKFGSESFFINPPPETMIKIAPNGDRIYYHEKSNIVGILSKWKTPKAFFRPKNGKKFWKKQKGKLLIDTPQEKPKDGAAETEA